MKKLALLLLALSCALAHATITQPILIPKITFVDASGNPCAGCTLTSYIAGTTTALATYTNAAGSSQNTNPIVLDAAGGAVIWIGQTAYKFVLKDAGGGTIWTVDNVVSVTTLGCLGANAIDHGCTGATTSQGAATNIVDGNNIKPATVQNANVNGVFTVTKYGAVGDCTGSGSNAACTNNHDAIQAAFDAAYAVGGSVYFPINPATPNFQTVYYTATSINPKGIGMHGDPGMSGAAGYYTNSAPVAVRGAPSKDVFDVVDAASVGYVEPYSSYTVQDLAILVDNSIDANASFTTRKPGRRCDDVVATGTAVITSTAQCEWQPGDVGQAIKVGSTSTTILSWQSATQVTLNTTIGAGTGITAYISVMGLSVTANIGNCGFAYDDATATYSGPHPSKVLFSNVVIDTITNNPTNSTCGFFFQGNHGPTITRWDNVFVGTDYGFSFVPASGVAPSSSIWTGIADNNVWDHAYIWSEYPFLVYSGEFQEIRAMQIAVEKYGPHIINAYGVVGGSTNWTINIPEMEPENGCGGGATSFRIAGTNHLIQHLALGDCSTGGAIFQWDASTSKVESLRANRLSAWNINGDHNRFYYPTDANELNGVPINNTGVDNKITVGSDHPTFVGLEPARERFIPGSTTTFGPPQLSRGSIVFDRKADFIDKGAATYYFNAEDLWMWPQEMGGLGTGNAATLADATSPTGSSLVIPLSGTVQYVGEANGTNLYIGSQIPAGKFRVYFSAKAASSVTLNVAVSAYYSAAWHDICNGAFTGVTTSYVTYSCDADATGLTGDLLRIAMGTTGSVDTQVAWIGIRPYDDILAATISVLGSYVPRTSGTNGWYTVGIDGTIDEDVNTGSLADNSPTTVTLPFALPTAAMSCVCSDNSGRVQSGNDQPVGCNFVGLSAPFTTIIVNTPSTTVTAYCRVRGY